jgi:uncharacterized cupredoxin-like copper-binding protein
MKRTGLLLGLSLVLIGSMVSCGSDSGGAVAATAVSATNVTEHDFEITLNDTLFKSGDVSFTVHNAGPSVHEFVIVKTDLAADALPTKTEDGAEIVDEDGEGFTAVDEIEDIQVDADETMTANLSAGKYVVFCNIPGHYLSGMHTPFTVED